MEVNVSFSVMIRLGLHLTGIDDQGLRLVNKMTKQFFGKSNGQKITTWPIKYPHIKKNAQHGNTPNYRASKPLSTSMRNWFINLLLGTLITLALLALVQITSNFIEYGWY